GLLTMLVKNKQIQIFKWMRLAQDFAKLNVDGSSIDNPVRSGGGGILRDVKGHMVFAFVKYYGINLNSIDEIQVLSDGLNI
ncbi:hypothetical protein, partial [Salmonella sp. zj-f50]|uniref:hypothetical protein n=1 Tax=Salmonella sp. zj-f50 TaxID=2582616 RepID=UPI001F18E09F